MKNFIKFISLLIFPHLGLAQNPDKFEEIYKKVYLEISQENFEKALEISDSLYSISESIPYRIKSLMLTATLWQQKSNYSKAIEYAISAQKLVEDTEDPIQKMKIYGFLATQYRLSSLFYQSNFYLQTAIKESEKIKAIEQKSTFLGIIYQEKAYLEIDKKRYLNAITHINSSQKYFTINKNSNYNFFTASNEQLLGLCYYQLNDLENSFIHYNKSLDLFKDHPNNNVKILSYNGLAKIYIKRNNLSKAKEYIVLLKDVVNRSEYLSLKEELLKTIEEFGQLENKTEEVLEIRKSRDSISNKIQENINTLVDKEQEKLLINNQNLNKKKSYNFYYALTISIFSLIGILCFLLYRKKYKNNLKIIKKELFQLKDKKFQKDKREIVISAVVEKKILAKLELFETNLFFNKKTITLASLATFCDTNVKYMSHVINSHKNKDFNNYINSLRINYIVDKLNQEPVYRKYKISYLADKCGFSSSSKFINAFKKEKQITPGNYINQLNKEKTIL